MGYELVIRLSQYERFRGPLEQIQIRGEFFASDWIRTCRMNARTELPFVYIHSLHFTSNQSIGTGLGGLGFQPAEFNSLVNGASRYYRFRTYEPVSYGIRKIRFL